MNEMSIIQSNSDIITLEKPLQLFFGFFLHTCFVLGDGTKNHSWENMWWED